jgi:hypothetical protein
MAWGDPVTHATGDVFPASDWNSYVRDDLRFLHDMSTVASATTIAPTTQYAKVTGTTTVRNITSASHTVVRLWFAGALTVEHNGGGTGNIRLKGAVNYLTAAGDVIDFAYDSSAGVWNQVGAQLVAPVSPAMELIYDNLLASDAASIDWQSIPATYKHLMFLFMGLAAASGSSDLRIRFNNDSASGPYSQGWVVGENPGTITEHEETNLTGLILDSALAISSPAVGVVRVEIPHYAGTTLRKVANLQWGTFQHTLVGQGFWANTAAINRITLAGESGNLKAGSRATLYGF